MTPRKAGIENPNLIITNTYVCTVWLVSCADHYPLLYGQTQDKRFVNFNSHETSLLATVEPLGHQQIHPISVKEDTPMQKTQLFRSGTANVALSPAPAGGIG